MKTKCYSVRLQCLTQISSKCWKAIDWQNNTYLIPDSQYFGRDYEVQKSEAHWVASWIIDKEDCKLIVSTKKEAWFDKATGNLLPTYIVEKHIPEKVEAKENSVIERLKK